MATPRLDPETTGGEASEHLPLSSRARAKDAPWRQCLEDLAKSPLTPVLLVGPGGVGAARRLHRLTYRGTRAPFVHVDCTWLPERDVNRLLFGSESASKIERGFVERANGGTLFLDDIEELPANEQARVAELLDSMRFRRAFGQDDVHVSLRVVACLAGTEEQALTTGRLHRDLHARLSVLPVVLR
ncbi:MAG TPA: sigma 54-interacting transcriptional regulator [Gaiellaceae bacterium]|nr:sigma 54-interacting transcriptional regulator [Gaiellaceae bacterium]